MKFIKVLAYVLVVLCLIFIPVYAASRIFLPNWVTSKISNNMPAGTVLSIGNISSTPNLGILYEDVAIDYQGNFKVYFEDLKIQPRLSFAEPLHFISKKAIINSGNTTAVFSQINSRLNYISDGSNNSILLKGDVDSLSSKQLAAASNIEFILRGFGSSKQIINIEASNFDLNFPTPSGSFIFKGNKFKLDAKVGDDLETKIFSEPVILDLSMIGTKNQNRVILAKSAFIEINLLKEKNWNLPLSLRLDDFSTPNGDLGKRLNFSAMGLWRGGNQDCFLSDLLNGNDNCGKMTDVEDFVLDFKNEKGHFNFFGSGFCITPNSGCLQEIKAELKTKNTAEIFSSIMISDIINPIITGVIMGSMLSSPDNQDSAYDHRISLEVKGSKITVNGKSLF